MSNNYCAKKVISKMSCRRKFVTFHYGVTLLILTILCVAPLLIIYRTSIIQDWYMRHYYLEPLAVTTHAPVKPSGFPLVTSPTGQTTSLLKPSDHFVVPSLVHYVWFGEYEPMKFHHYLSIRSAYRFIKPEKIVFHCDHQPTGTWWQAVKQSVPSLRVEKYPPPSEIFGNEIILPEHKSDVARMEILMKYGGIYLDTDVIALKSFDDLRKYNMTMGLEYHGSPGRLNNGVIVATKDAEFLRVWHETYRDFTKREWDLHDSIIPYSLQFEHPHLIHVEEKTINWPSGRNLSMIYEQVYDWSSNYAMHLWYRLHEIEHNPHDIRAMNTTFGQIARLIYYGTSDLLK